MVDYIIRLFESTDTTYTTNGIGYLVDAISCTVTEERNGAFELSMVYPVTGRRFKELSLRRIIVTKSNPYSDPQAFRIYEITKPINGKVKVSAEHISYDMSGFPVSPFEASGVSTALNGLKQHSVVTCPFNFWTDKPTTTDSNFQVKTPTSMRALLGGVEGSILDIFGGGEYEFNNFLVKLYQHRGYDRGVVIRYGKNLLDLEQEENCASVYTGVYPYWYSDEEGLVELPDKIIYAEGTYNFERILPLDLSGEFAEKPEISALENRATKYVQDNNIGVPKVSIEVSFVHLADANEFELAALLETVYLCDSVTVEFPEMGVKATSKCIKTVYDVISNKYTSLTLGESRSSIADTISGQESFVKDSIDSAIAQNDSNQRLAIKHATDLITGNLGGYVVLHSSTGQDWPDELLIMDTTDINTAQKIWRWNVSGWGYSKHGYNGPFETAATMDGIIVADFIQAGTMSANRIQGGTLTLGGQNNGNGTFTLLDQNGKVFISGSKDGIRCFGYRANEVDSSVLLNNGGMYFYGPDSNNSKGRIRAGGYVQSDGSIKDLEIAFGSTTDEYRTTIFSGAEGKGARIYLGNINEESHDFMEIMEYYNNRGFLSTNNPWRHTGFFMAGRLYTDRLCNADVSQSNGGAYFNMKTSPLKIYCGTQGSLNIEGNFFVNSTGYKSKIMDTKTYGDRAFFCYETTSPMFGDIGTGKTDEFGECIVSINDIFLESVKDQMDYMVFLTAQRKGNINISKKFYNYFVVKGDPDVEFAWEIKAYQKHYNGEIMESMNTIVSENEKLYSDEEQYQFEIIETIKNMEELYNDEIII